jgi:hypothetical protein
VYFPGHSPSLARSDRDRSALAEAVGQRVQFFAVERQGFELEGTTFPSPQQPASSVRSAVTSASDRPSRRPIP